MTESQMPWGNENVFDWYEESCDSTVLIPIGDNGTGLELLEALGDIHALLICEDEEHNHTKYAAELVKDLGELILGTALGEGQVAMENVIVKQEMKRLEEELNGMSNE